MQGTSLNTESYEPREKAIRRAPVPADGNDGWGKNPEVGGKCPKCPKGGLAINVVDCLDEIPIK
jgi:hypothetical protein